MFKTTCRRAVTTKRVTTNNKVSLAHKRHIGLTAWASNPRASASSSSQPEIKVPNLSFSDFLLDEALERHTAPALVCADTNNSYSYGALKEKVNDMAIQYYIRGWEKGETLAVIMPNNFIYPITVLAAAKVGIPVTLVNHKWKSRQMVKQLKASRVSYIITTQSLLPVVRDAHASLRNIKEILVLDKQDDNVNNNISIDNNNTAVKVGKRTKKSKEEGENKKKEKEGAEEGDNNNIKKEKKEFKWSIEMKYNLLFGKPPAWGALPDWEISPDNIAASPFADFGDKGLNLTHRHLSSSLLQLEREEKDINNNSVVLCSLPFSDPFNMMVTTSLPLFKGSKVVISESAASSASSFLSTAQKHGVTYAVTSKHILQEIASGGSYKDIPSSLKVILVNDEIDGELKAKLTSKLPKIAIKQGYGVDGLTPPISIGNTTGNDGIPLPQTQVKINDTDGSLLIKGPQLPSEYIPIIQKPGISKSSNDKSEQFLQTLDKAKIDSKGNLVVSRHSPTEDI